jgi:4'-phosphopantetheinyl transferase
MTSALVKAVPPADGAPRLRLLADEVHVWHATLEVDAATLAALHRLLAADERVRAGRFRFSRDRYHFVACRGLLRRLLGDYLGCDPGAVVLGEGPRGKPRLEPPRGALEFNASHSFGRALLAFARGRRLGVDLERIRADLATDGIAESSFSAGELAELRALPRAQQLDGFFNAWTRKEAFVKAVGEGVYYGLDCFDVSLAPEREPRLLHTRRDPAEAARWSLRALDAPAGFAAAIVVEGAGFAIASFDLAGGGSRADGPPSVRAAGGSRR